MATPKKKTQDMTGARTKIRSVRVSDELWDSAVTRAKADGTTTAEVIRDALIKHLGLPDGVRGVLGRKDRESPTDDPSNT